MDNILFAEQIRISNKSLIISLFLFAQKILYALPTTICHHSINLQI